MNIGEALTAVAQGKSARRPSYRQGWQYKMSEDDVLRPVLRLYNSQTDTWSLTVLTSEDLLAEDWELV